MFSSLFRRGTNPVEATSSTSVDGAPPEDLPELREMLASKRAECVVLRQVLQELNIDTKAKKEANQLELAVQRSQLQDKESSITSLCSAMETHKAMLGKGVEEVGTITQQIKENCVTLDELQASLVRLRADLKAGQLACANCSSRIEATQQEEHSMRQTKARKLKRLTDQITELTERVKNCEASSKEIDSKLAPITKEQEAHPLQPCSMSPMSALPEFAELQDAIMKLRFQIQNEKIENMDINANNAKDVNDLKSDKSRLEAKLKEMQDKLTQIKNDSIYATEVTCQGVSKTISNLQRELDVLSEKLKALVEEEKRREKNEQTAEKTRIQARLELQEKQLIHTHGEQAEATVKEQAAINSAVKATISAPHTETGSRTTPAATAYHRPSARSLQLQKEHPNSVPVRCVRGDHCTCAALSTTTFMVSKHTTLMGFQVHVRSKLALTADTPFEILLAAISGTLKLNPEDTMQGLYEWHKSLDGYLHLCYTDHP